MSSEENYALEACIWELASTKTVEPLCANGLPFENIENEDQKKTKSDHFGGHQHHTSGLQVTQA